MDGTMSGYYKAVFTNASGCESAVTIKVVVDDPEHPFVEPDTSVNDTSVTDSAGDSTTAIGLRGFGEFYPGGALDAGGASVCPLFNAGEPVQVFDMLGHSLGIMREEKVRTLGAGVYLLRAGKNVRKVRVE